MSTQFELPFEEGTVREPERSLEELVAEYKTRIGVSPRTSDPAEIAAALQDPEAELARLRAEDAEDDKTDIRRTYRS